MEGKRIKDIKLIGLVSTDKDIVVANLTHERGSIFKYKVLTQEFKTLYNLGYFELIKIDLEIDDKDQLILKYIFTELPTIREIRISGNDELNDDEIIDAMFLRTGNVYKETTLKADKDRIINLYRKKGFDGTIVSISANYSTDGRYVNVIVNVKEGEEVKVEKITILGAKYLDPDDVKDVMETSEPGWFSSDPLDEDKIDEDRKKIVQFYKDHGYIKAQIKKFDVKKKTISQGSKEKGYFITIEVEEGDQYKLGKVEFSGYKIFKEKHIREWLECKEGEIYNDSKFKADITKISTEYYNRGYINAQIIPIDKIDEARRIIHFKVEITENEKVHIERIIIKGNDKTDTYVIDRELQIREGELFSLNKIRRSVEKLTNTGYFKRIDPRPSPGSEDGLVDLIFEMEEQRTGIVTLGAGYGTATGFSAFTQIVEKNFLGKGWAIGSRLEYGTLQQRYEINTETNWLLYYIPLGFQASLSYNFWIVDIDDTTGDDTNSYWWKDAPLRSFYNGLDTNYNIKSWQIDTGLSYQLTDNWVLFGGFFIDLSKAFTNTFLVKDLNPERELYKDLQQGWTTRRTLRSGIGYDTRDFILNPTKGFRTTVVGRYTGGILGGESNWLRLRNDYQYYISTGSILFKDWPWTNAFNVGFETTFKQFDGKFNISDIELLSFDGMTELRGYGYRELEGYGKTTVQYELRWQFLNLFFIGYGS